MTIKFYKNLLSSEECKYLNFVANKCFDLGILKIVGYQGRYTTRFVSNNSNFDFPEKIYEISKKIRNVVGIENYPLETHRGKNGINVAVTVENGFVELHTDPRGADGSATYRCNVVTQKSDIGGNLIIDGEELELNVGDVHCYAVSEVPHIVTETKGDTPRILWMFGCQIPLNEIHDFI